jgi:hypothetical protein
MCTQDDRKPPARTRPTHPTSHSGGAAVGMAASRGPMAETGGGGGESSGGSNTVRPLIIHE